MVPSAAPPAACATPAASMKGRMRPGKPSGHTPHTGGLAPSKEDGTMCTDLEDKMKSALQEIAEMKIPYCDADDVAHSMRDIARDALSDKCRGES